MNRFSHAGASGVGGQLRLLQLLLLLLHTITITTITTTSFTYIALRRYFRKVFLISCVSPMCATHVTKFPCFPLCFAFCACAVRMHRVATERNLSMNENVCTYTRISYYYCYYYALCVMNIEHFAKLTSLML